jgi:hypothetical protein
MNSGVGLVLGGFLLMALAAGCMTTSRTMARSTSSATPCVTSAPAPVGSGTSASASPAPEGDSLQVSDKQIDNNIDQILAARGVTKEEVIAMSQAKVDPALIINHIRARGVTAPLSAEDLILLQQSGVSSQVIATMQAVSTPPQRTVVIRDHYVPTIVGVRPYYGPPVVYYRYR